MKTITPKESSLYSLLPEESKRTVDALIESLYNNQAEELNHETIQAIEDVNNRMGVVKLMVKRGYNEIEKDILTLTLLRTGTHSDLF